MARSPPRALRGRGAGSLPGAALAALLLAAAATPAAPGPRAPAAVPAVHVHVEGLAFNPFAASLLAGESVGWHNHDDNPHKPVAEDGSFDAGTVGPGETVVVDFAEARTIPYLCEFHATMTGRVVVSEPGALADLAIQAVEPVEVVPGVLMELNVTVRNLGRATAGASALEVLYRYHGADYLIANAATPEVGPGASQPVVVEWFTAGKVGDFLVRLRADVLQQVPEGDEANNDAARIASVLYPGFPGLDLTDPV